MNRIRLLVCDGHVIRQVGWLRRRWQVLTPDGRDLGRFRDLHTATHVCIDSWLGARG